MGLNVKKILEHVGETREEFSDNIGISLEELEKYEMDKLKPSGDIVSKINEYTGLPLAEIASGEMEKRIYANFITPNNTWIPSRTAKNDLVSYLREGKESLNDQIIQGEITKVEACVRALRKPKISFAGQSDTGKSTLINALVGGEHLPAKWTPTTSIVVYIKHTKDRPEFIQDDVWIFGKKGDQFWNDDNLSDERYCREYLLAAGDYELLETYGIHQTETEKTKEAFSAVAFIDSPLLEDCDILDLPGFAANSEDDALHKFNTQENTTDILIYLSRANGFLQDRDLDYLNVCLNALRPIEKKGVNAIDKLENLFIVASQANSINMGNAAELREIIQGRCHALCMPLEASAKLRRSSSLLSARTKITGYRYDEEDFRNRFFTFERDSERLCKKFLGSFRVLIEKIPCVWHEEFCDNLEQIKSDSITFVKSRLEEYKVTMEKRNEYLKLYKEIKEKEPARKVKQSEKNRQMFEFIEELRVRTKQEYLSFYTEYMCEENLIDLMDSNGIKDKKSLKQEFSTLVNKAVVDNIHTLLHNLSEEYIKRQDEFLKDYSDNIICVDIDENIEFEFNVINSFEASMISLGAVGVVGTWLATSATPWVVAALGAWAGLGSIMAVGGAIGIGIGGIIASVVSMVKHFTWKKNLAKDILDTYKKEKFVEKIFEDADKYWDDSEQALHKGFEQIEKDWEAKIEEMGKLADEDNIGELQKKVQVLTAGLDFFTKIPLPKKS